jgi:hypothetical protein
VLQYSPQGRAERLIAGGRVVLATSALVAVWLDPSKPPRDEPTAYAVLSPYVGYAAVLAGLAWRTAPPSRRLRLATHVLDLGVFVLVLYFTGEPTGPFFMLFVFSIAAATLRWGWPGTLWTGSAAVLLFVAMGVSSCTRSLAVRSWRRGSSPGLAWRSWRARSGHRAPAPGNVRRQVRALVLDPSHLPGASCASRAAARTCHGSAPSWSPFPQARSLPIGPRGNPVLARWPATWCPLLTEIVNREPVSALASGIRQRHGS